MAGKSIRPRAVCVLLLCIISFVATGCTSSVKPLSPSTLDYFKVLEEQKYWTSTNPQLTLDTPEESKAVFVSDDAGERSLLFGKVDVLTKDKKGNPTKAVISATICEEGKTSTCAFLVSDSNRTKLSDGLKAFETDQERTERLRKEEEQRKREQERLKKERETSQRMQKLAKAFRRTYDEFRQITFIEHPLDPETLAFGKPYFFPYIGYNKESKWMFLRMQMYTEDWLFADSVIVLVGDKSYSTPQYESYDRNVTHDVWSGGVFERIDFRWSDVEVQSLGRAIASAPLGTKIKVRFQGKQHKDFTLTQAEHLAWKDMIFYFDNLKPGS